MRKGEGAEEYYKDFGGHGAINLEMNDQPCRNALFAPQLKATISTMVSAAAIERFIRLHLCG
jgi:hypothetical protein